MKIGVLLLSLLAAGCATSPPDDGIIRVGMPWNKALAGINRAGLREVTLQTDTHNDTDTFHDFSVPGMGPTRFEVSKADRRISAIFVMTRLGRKTNARWTSFKAIDLHGEDSQQPAGGGGGGSAPQQ